MRMLKASKKKKKINYFIAALALLFFILILNKSYLEKSDVSKYIVKASINLAKPLFYIQKKFISSEEKIAVYFKTKKELDLLNKNLQEENLKITLKLERAEMLEKDNDALLKTMGEKNQKDFLTAYVIFSPPSSNFDTLIIDRGEKDGVKKGMKAVAYENVMLGEVMETFQNMSVIKLLSYYGNNLNVLLENTNTIVSASGKGGENFEIILEKEMDVRENENIFLPNIHNFIIGKITKIEKEENMPFQKVYFRFPLNLNQLKYIRLMPGADIINMEDIKNK